MKTRILLSILFALAFALNAGAQQKKVITKAEDLPKHSYVLPSNNAETIIRDKEMIMDLAMKMKKDVENDLNTYDIQDNATLSNYYGLLQLIYILEGDYAESLELIQKRRKLADKPSAKITRGLTSEAMIRAAKELESQDPAVLSERITENLMESMNVSDFAVIQEDIEEFKGQSEILSENLLISFVQGETQTAIDNNKGKVPGELATSLLEYYYTLNYYLPYKEIYNQAFSKALDTYGVSVEKQNIWTDREVELSKAENSVVIGIWDTGTDTDVFPSGSIWVNKNEIKDDVDNDNNGYVDDIYGIGYNMHGKKETNVLQPIGEELEEQRNEMQKNMKGLMDITSNINSEEASTLKKKLSGLPPEELNEMIERIGAYSHYCHGTHVSGIAVKGNPGAQILSARLAFDHRHIPYAPTEESAKQWATMFKDVINYFKENNVRVVNMSWTVDLNYEFMRPFELNGIGENDEERRILAKKLFEIEKEAFIEAVESAPGILFVCGAGNNNDDADFMGAFPASLNLPNILTVGAVDIEGKKTGFTTEGASVDVYANGYEVESYVPGGDVMAFSGTSMASPQVANLAAKILTVNPDLSPQKVAEIIRNSATVSEEDEKVRLIHPKKAVELAMK